MFSHSGLFRARMVTAMDGLAWSGRADRDLEGAGLGCCWNGVVLFGRTLLLRAGYFICLGCPGFRGWDYLDLELGISLCFLRIS